MGAFLLHGEITLSVINYRMLEGACQMKKAALFKPWPPFLKK